MKASQLASARLLLFFACVVQVCGQPNEADHKLFEEVKTKAEMGDTEAQFCVGFCYENGKGTTQSAVDAVKWYRKAATQGLPVAQFYLGLSYSRGSGVAKDTAE